MANASQTFITRKGYFHSLSRVPMHDTQNYFESTIKSGHNILGTEVWIDSISYCSNEAERDQFIINNPNILKYNDKMIMEPVIGTNNQLWRVVDGNVWQRRWVAPVDVQNPLGLTSQGFSAKLYQNNNILISLTEGVYVIDYASSVVLFQAGYTPIDLGYSLPLKISFTQYIGRTLDDTNLGLDIVTQELDYSQYFALTGDGTKISNNYTGTLRFEVVTDNNGNVLWQ